MEHLEKITELSLSFVFISLLMVSTSEKTLDVVWKTCCAYLCWLDDLPFWQFPLEAYICFAKMKYTIHNVFVAVWVNTDMSCELRCRSWSLFTAMREFWPLFTPVLFMLWQVDLQKITAATDSCRTLKIIWWWWEHNCGIFWKLSWKKMTISILYQQMCIIINLFFTFCIKTVYYV